MARWQLDHPAAGRRSRRRRPAATVAVPIILIALQAPSAIACGDRMPPRGSVDAAVTALSDCYFDRSLDEDREYVAAILQTPQGFVGLVMVNEPGHDRFHLRFRLAADERLVALWHTHGAAGPSRELFSSADTRVANELGLHSYLTTPAGETRLYVPGSPTPTLRDRFRRVLPHGSATGSVVRPDRPAAPTVGDRAVASL
ncbi:MAG TPA: DUF4329 domain-containing protein [Pseudomonadales bacterium]